MSSRRRAVSAVLGLLVSALFVYLAVRRIHLGDVARRIVAVNLWCLAASLVTKLIGFLWMTWRSSVLMRPLCSLPPGRLFRSLLIAFGGNNVLPFRMGELLRVDYLARHSGVPRPACLAVVGMERLLDVFTVLVLFLAVTPALVGRVPLGRSLPLVALCIAAAVLAAVVASRRASWLTDITRRTTRVLGSRVSAAAAKRISQFAGGLAALSSIREVLLVIGLSFAYWSTSLASVQLWLWAFDLHLPWYAPVVILGFTAFGTAMPSSPAFIGTYHYFAAAGVSFFGVDHATALSFAVVGHAVSIVPFSLLSGGVVLQEWMEFHTRGARDTGRSSDRT